MTGDDRNENFYMNMTLDETPNNNLHITQCSSFSTKEPMQYEAKSSSSMTQQVTVEFPQQYRNVLAEIKTEIDRFAQLFEANPTIYNLRAVTTFTNMIKKLIHQSKDNTLFFNR